MLRVDMCAPVVDVCGVCLLLCVRGNVSECSVRSAPDPRALISENIQRRCKHLRLPPRDIAATLNLVLRPESARKGMQEAGEVEGEDDVVGTAVNCVVASLSDAHRRAMLEEAFASLLAVTLAQHTPIDRVIPLAFDDAHTRPLQPTTPTLEGRRAMLQAVGRALAAMRQSDGCRRSGPGKGGLDRSERVLDMLTLGVLHDAWPDADYPKYTFPLQRRILGKGAGGRELRKGGGVGREGDAWAEQIGESVSAQRDGLSERADLGIVGCGVCVCVYICT